MFPSSVILLPFLGIQPVPFEFGKLGINSNKFLMLGKKSPKLGENRPLFGLGSSLYLAVKKNTHTLLSPLFSHLCNVKDGTLKLYQEAI